MGSRVQSRSPSREKMCIKSSSKNHETDTMQEKNNIANSKVGQPSKAKTKHVVVVGGGVIGGGWAARFALNGLDVTVVDCDPKAEHKVSVNLATARRAFHKLTLAPQHEQGEVKVTTHLVGAISKADFIIEALPDVEKLKQSVLAQIDKASRPDVVIASSTSGLLPTRLQAHMSHPERLVVAHPFNPVYLLPLVEVLGGKQTAEHAKEEAAALFETVGMHPLRLDVEIDGFVSDRLLEAVWREGLHLVNDGVATVSQIDDAIRYGPGLRWAFMGSFQTYRLGGGEGGMQHFLSQFGPALKLPWTKLEAPELSDKLVDRILEQSEEQTGTATCEDMIQRRDDCLIAILQALREQDCAAGSVLKRYEKKLYANASQSVRTRDEHDITKPLRMLTTRVNADWIDYNGHMTESRYLQVFGDATDALLQYVGADAEYIGKGFSYYTVETHIMNKKEATSGEPLVVATHLLSVDEKRIHLFHTIEHGHTGTALATAEQMMLHVNTKKSRACPADPAIVARLTCIVDGQKGTAWPLDAGRFVGAPRASTDAGSFVTLP